MDCSPFAVAHPGPEDEKSWVKRHAGCSSPCTCVFQRRQLIIYRPADDDDDESEKDDSVIPEVAKRLNVETAVSPLLSMRGTGGSRSLNCHRPKRARTVRKKCPICSSPCSKWSEASKHRILKPRSSAEDFTEEKTLSLCEGSAGADSLGLGCSRRLRLSDQRTLKQEGQQMVFQDPSVEKATENEGCRQNRLNRRRTSGEDLLEETTMMLCEEPKCWSSLGSERSKRQRLSDCQTLEEKDQHVAFHNFPVEKAAETFLIKEHEYRKAASKSGPQGSLDSCERERLRRRSSKLFSPDATEPKDEEVVALYTPLSNCTGFHSPCSAHGGCCNASESPSSDCSFVKGLQTDQELRCTSPSTDEHSQKWGIGLLFQSMKSKLENFTEKLFTPVKWVLHEVAEPKDSVSSQMSPGSSVLLSPTESRLKTATRELFCEAACSSSTRLVGEEAQPVDAVKDGFVTKELNDFARKGQTVRVAEQIVVSGLTSPSSTTKKKSLNFVTKAAASPKEKPLSTDKNGKEQIVAKISPPEAGINVKMNIAYSDIQTKCPLSPSVTGITQHKHRKRKKALKFRNSRTRSSDTRTRKSASSGIDSKVLCNSSEVEQDTHGYSVLGSQLLRLDSCSSCNPSSSGNCCYPVTPQNCVSPVFLAARLSRSHSWPDFPSSIPQIALETPLNCSKGSLACCEHKNVSLLQRKRRHTLCSEEVAREFLCQPLSLLCLKKEVFPSAPLSTNVEGFLSSPIAFVSQCSNCSPFLHISGSKDAASPSPSPHAKVTPVSREEAQQLALLGSRFETSPFGDEERVEYKPPAPKRQRMEQSAGRKRSSLVEQGCFSDFKRKNMDAQQNGKAGKVSSFPIRKTPAKLQYDLTPMGLPKPIRLKKKEFTLEEIYTNKNYATPAEKRTFETIFEEPLKKNGAVIFTSQRKVKRFMEFHDGSLPRRARRSHIRRKFVHRGRGECSKEKAPDLETILWDRLAELEALDNEEERGFH